MSSRRNRQLALLLAASGLLALTFAQPTLQLLRPTYRYVFVFDITQSMNVTDVGPADAPLTRLAYAKRSALEAVRDLPCGTEIGLALFTGHRAFLMVTPIEICANYREFSAVLNGINWRMTWETRSEVAKGIYKSIELMTLLPDLTRVVFFTDGHEAPPINPDVPPHFPGARGAVEGLIVGVGGDAAVPIPKFDKHGEADGYWQAEDVLQIDTFRAERNAREGKPALTTGTEHLSSLRQTYLEGLATQTGLRYIRLGSASVLSRQLQHQALGIPRVMTTDVRWIEAAAALLALLATMVRMPRRKRNHTDADPV